MSAGAVESYEIAVIGAGPVGAVSALAHARRGASVALIEANPKGAARLAGEWLHPPAIDERPDEREKCRQCREHAELHQVVGGVTTAGALMDDLDADPSVGAFLTESGCSRSLHS